MLTGLFIVIGGVVAGRQVAVFRRRVAGMGDKIKAAHQLYAVGGNAVPATACLRHILAFSIDERTVWVARARNEQVISIGGLIAAKGGELLVLISFKYVHDDGTLDIT